MNLAKQIKHFFDAQLIKHDINDVMDTLNETALDINQDWDREATIYTLDDGSILEISGSSLTVIEND